MGAKGAIGRQAAQNRTPDEDFEVVSTGMHMPGWRQASEPREALQSRTTGERPCGHGASFDSRAGPVHLGPGRWFTAVPRFGQRAAALIPNAHLEVVPGEHARFLDDRRVAPS
jgi:hypothetical protein